MSSWKQWWDNWVLYIDDDSVLKKKPNLELSLYCSPCIGCVRRGGNIRDLQPRMIIADHNLRTCNNQRGNFYPKPPHELSPVCLALAQWAPCKHYNEVRTSCESPRYSEFYRLSKRWRARCPAPWSKPHTWNSLDGKACRWLAGCDRWLAYCKRCTFREYLNSRPHSRVFPIVLRMMDNRMLDQGSKCVQIRWFINSTYIYSIELFSSQWLGTNGTGETINMINFVHCRATVALANDLVATFVTHSKEIFRHFDCIIETSSMM